MGLWGSIKHAAKKVAHKVKQVAKAVGDAIKDNVEAAASAIVAPLRDAALTIKHVAIGIFKYATGDRRGAQEEFSKAKRAASEIISDIVGGAAGLALLVGVNYVSFVQRVIGIESEDRRLTEKERLILERIFRGAVNYDAVRITEGNLGLLGSRGRVFTAGYKIRVPSSSGWYPLSAHQHVLVHEMVHVWQFENGGPDYVPEALLAQNSGGGGYVLDDTGTTPVPADPGYAFDAAVATGKHWADFNPEQQATFVEIAFQTPVDFDQPHSTPMVFNGVDYSSELDAALTYIRSGEGTP